MESAETRDGQAANSEERDEIAKLKSENATLREQMLQANLYELQQRRLKDSLQAEMQAEIERLQLKIAELSGERHD